MTIYTPMKNTLLTGGINLDTADLRAILIDTADYVFSAAHTFLSDVPAAARVAVSGTLANTTVTGGILDADDVTINAVSGDTVEAVLVYEHTGVDGTSRLVRFIDKASDGTTNIAFTPNGSAVTVQWSATGIVRL